MPYIFLEISQGYTGFSVIKHSSVKFSSFMLWLHGAYTKRPFCELKEQDLYSIGITGFTSRIFNDMKLYCARIILI